MNKEYKKISQYAKSVLSREKDIEFLEWIHIPCLDHPLIIRVTSNNNDKIDEIEMTCQKYLEKGLMVIVRPSQAISGEKIAQILKNSQEKPELPTNHLPLEIKTILKSLTLKAVDYLAEKKITYICFYEIMYENDSTPVFNVIMPTTFPENVIKPEVKKFAEDNREVQIIPWDGLDDFLSLIYVTVRAHQENRALINYLKSKTD